MDDFVCPVCYNKFDNKEFIPKVLECGHSLCSNCLSEILLQSDAVCPTCRASITNKESFATNYSLLNLVSKCEEVLGSPKVKAELADLKRKVTKLLSEVKEEMISSCKSMGILESTLSRIVELEKFDEKNISVKKALHDISKMKKNLVIEKLEPEFFAKEETLNLDYFVDEKEYFNEICRKLNSGHVFAIHPVGKEHKYGKIKFDDDKIYIHCLSSLPEKPNNASYVWFQDLKRYCLRFTVEAFLLILDNDELETTVMIELRIVNDFLKWCTGEIGPSYKGEPCERMDERTYGLQQILSVGKSMCDGKTGIIDYRAKEPQTDVKYAEIVICVNDDLSFNISRVSDTRLVKPGHIIGKVVSAHNWDNILSSSKFPMQIKNCGLYFKVPHQTPVR